MTCFILGYNGYKKGTTKNWTCNAFHDVVTLLSKLKVNILNAKSDILM